MSESLSEDELADLIRNGRINTPRSAAKRRETKPTGDSVKKDNNEPRNEKRASVPGTSDRSSQKVGKSPKTSSGDEINPEWLRAEKEKAERNIAAPSQDKRRREEMQEASKF